MCHFSACRVFFLGNDAPGIFEHVYCELHQCPLISCHPDMFSKSGQSDKMTMPARRASQFSAKWRAIKLQTIVQSLNYQAIPGFCEAWSECQPEESRNDADDDDNDAADDEPTTARPHSHRQANTPRDQISRSGDTPHSDLNGIGPSQNIY